MSVQSRLRLLVPATVLTMVAAFAAAISPPAQGSPHADDTPVLLTPKGEHESGEEEPGFDKLRDAYYWSRLLSGDDPISVGRGRALPHQGGHAGQGDPEPRADGRRARRSVDQSGAEPDRPGRPHHQHLRGGLRAHRRAGDPQRRHPHPGRRAGRRVDLRRAAAAPGRRAPTTPTPSRSARSRLRRATTTSSTWARARARCPATATTATASTGRPTAASPGSTSRTCSPARRSPTSRSTRPTPSTCTPSTVRGRGGNHRTSRADQHPLRRVRVDRRRRHLDAAQGHHERAARCHRPGDGPAERRATCSRRSGATDLPDHRRRCHLAQRAWATCRRATTSRAAPASPSGISHPAGGQLADAVHRLRLLRPRRHLPQRADLQDAPTTARTGRPRPPAAASTRSSTTARTQCFYDNEVKPDPTNPDVVYVEGPYGYNFSPPSGGIFRSTDGGATWKNLGYDLHPDFHAIAFQPTTPSTSRSATTAACGSRTPAAAATTPVTRSPRPTGRTSTARSTRTPPR